MCTLIWLMVGIVLLTITIFVHRHSYERGCNKNKRGDKLPFPMWLMAIMVFLSLIPVINLMAFGIGAFVYCMNYNNYEGVLFHCEARWWKALVGFLTREV
ncbi:MAG: hypothetical protein IJV29_18920 [Butyrivibrio sp.]|nr:hypothetical protein [Butyrivibrio sp.]MBQ7431686.1 hypothetical protein [Butyrivibrio sp.]